MPKYFFKILSLILFSYGLSYSQEKIELKNADELSGKIIDGQNVREANGNVEFVQGNVKVYCNSATQFIEANRVELRGNVRIYQDTLSLFTSQATYFGDDKKAICQGGVTLKDPNATVRADNGVYSFNERKAVFKGSVIVINPDYQITSGELTYLRDTEDSFAKGSVIVITDSAIIKAENIDFYKSVGRTFATVDVSIESDSTIITSDTATNLSKEKKSMASGNVKIVSLNNNTIVFGNNIENYETENYTILKGNAKLIQIEENKDTLFIYSDTMEAFRKSPEHYIAKGNVEVLRNEFLSRCGLGIYYKAEETVSLADEPIVWQENLQMTGDSIYAELPNNKLQTIFVKKLSSENSTNSFVISQNSDEYFKDRYDQISGSDITLSFREDKMNMIEVNENSISIYFLYEEEKANGANKVEGKDLYVYFDADEKVSKIKVDTDPKGEYIPEQLLSNTSLTLPGFNLRDDKPVRR
ncbi:MAG: LPS export ABC transporter periplasmic protein LptC [Bacteroidota bacterium]|nr:LPS export ABC transporter periplasmic protein LptC [Bacteroidota bacterium]